MVDAYFYKFSKKVNSTKRPASGTGTKIPISFKGNDSIVAPSILLDVNALDYDYCYIPTLNRYYFVSNMILSTNKVKEYSLSVDVLATYKTEILGSSKYVLRSASHPNQYISDPTWVHNSNYSESDYEIALPGYDSTGCYIVSIVNGNGIATANPASTMYVMNEIELAYLLKDMFDMDGNAYQNITDMDLTATFFNPFQYITSCRWYPFTVGSISSAAGERIKYGWYEANNILALGRKVTSYGTRKTVSLQVGTYSDWTDRDNNWTRYTCYIPSCGLVDIDAAYSGKTLTCNLDIDYNTGQTFATLVDGDTSRIVAQTSGLIGSEVAISQVAGNINIPGSIKDLANMGAGITGGFLARGGGKAIGQAVVNYQKMQGALAVKDYAGAREIMGNNVNAGKDAASAILDAVQQQVLNPTVSRSGADGCRNTIIRNHHFRMFKRKYNRYWDANSEIGGMCHSIRLLSTLSGYTQLANGVIDIGGTLEEKNGITTFLENGFYIE